LQASVTVPGRVEYGLSAIRASQALRQILQLLHLTSLKHFEPDTAQPDKLGMDVHPNIQHG
jgi:hypothetical protein